ncbi:cytoskeletal protein RodZ [Agrobacterium larrymoorei]|uniref:Cytoskeletal protein RodZ n=1 Tax=Agrobacterium larrymoorei TaxID=160699 RepID=A0AAJ2EQQ5_9HYPH|nr:hypothetical protein [Agrobacterium larrymoorei]MDR6100899.1 cytoskeletal protein RodZ [Agrobacterium larrymoorei]
MASKHKQEDPWAGFVDVLSNILMVVIFLVVILGISIFAISQQVTKNAVEQAIEKERNSKTKSTDTQPEPLVAEASQPDGKTENKAEEQAALPPVADSQQQAIAVETSKSAAKTEETTSTQPQTPGSAPEVSKPAQQDIASGSAGEREAAQATRVRQSDEVAGETNLSVRSARTNDQEQIEVASEEIKPSFGPIKVENADAALTLGFSKGSFRIDENTSQSIKTYLTDHAALKNKNIEVRAFAQSTVGSVSEARRIAYYRAMQTRTELLKNGYAADNIIIKVRESISPEEVDAVRVIIKP